MLKTNENTKPLRLTEDSSAFTTDRTLLEEAFCSKPGWSAGKGSNDTYSTLLLYAND